MSEASTPQPGKRRRTAHLLSSDEDEAGPSSRPGSSKRPTPSRSKRTVVESVDDEDGLSLLDSDSGSEDVQPKVVKRQRRQTVDRSARKAQSRAPPSTDGEDEGGEDEDSQAELIQAPTLCAMPRDVDGFIAGSITRVKLVNFMTYDHVEFYAGPHLNMILGPNGTGKSSVAAGLAIGLGFPPRVMGRAPDLRSYVKQGCEESWTEVELKGLPGKRNTVLSCRFTREDDKSEWKIDGQQATRKAVQKIVSDFGIQANNLCCFLPQDKVAEFAKMNTEHLLAETMRTAGDQRLPEWHKKLVENGKIRKTLAEDLKKQISDRDRIRIQVDQLAPDVEHFNEREELENNRLCYVHLGEAVRVQKIIHESKDVKKAQAKVEAGLRVLEAKRDRVKALSSRYEDKTTKASIKQKDAQDAVTQANQDMREPLKKITRKSTDIEDITNKLEAEKLSLTRYKDRRADAARLRDKAKAILDEPVENNTEKERQVIERRALHKQNQAKHRSTINGLRAQYDQHEQRISDLNKNINTSSNKLSVMQDRERQRENEARDFDPSINYVLDWLKAHEHELEHPVGRPPMMSVNLTNTQLASQVEGATSRGQRMTFIVQSQADYLRLLALNKHNYPAGRTITTGKNYPSGGVAVYLAKVTVDEASLNPRQPCSREKLQEIGFDGWASDYIQADPVVVAFLNKRCNMAVTAVTSRTTEEIKSKEASNAGIMLWNASNGKVSGKRSLYGKRDVQSQYNAITPAKAWVRSLDVEGIKNLSEEIADMKREKQDMEKPGQELLKKRDEARRKEQEQGEKITECDEEIKILQDSRKRHFVAGEDYKTQSQRYDDHGAEIEKIEKRREALRKQRLDNVKSRLPVLRQGWKACEAAMNATQALIETGLRLSHMKSNSEATGGKSKEMDEMWMERKEERRDLKIRATEIQKRREAEQENTTARLNEESAEVQAMFVEYIMAHRSDLDEEVIFTRLAEISDELELGVGISHDVVEKHARLSEELKNLEDRVDRQQSEYDDVDGAIQELQNKFDIGLNGLIEIVNKRFSALFDGIGCVGEVHVVRGEMFDKWGIEIMASFRDGEPLVRLSAQRQSGGERALATVIYLMSLADVGHTPFSLVDEINQGMDEHYERIAHNKLVEITCSANAQQYFLITPKLVTGLDYHPRMRMLNVGNGYYIPPPAQTTVKSKNAKSKANVKPHWSDLRGCIQAAKRARGLA